MGNLVFLFSNLLSNQIQFGFLFWYCIHLEVASNIFCLIINSPLLLVFAICVFFMILSQFNLYYWVRDLLRELCKKYEILLVVLFLVFIIFVVSEALLFISFFWVSFHSLSSINLGKYPVDGFYITDPCELTFTNQFLLSNAAVSLGGVFVSLEISLQLYILFILLSYILAWVFISLQIKEFRVFGLLINDTVYMCLFFYITGLHFFHLFVGLIIACVFFYGCNFSKKMDILSQLRVSEVLCFYNLQLFYWHFLEILWLFIFL